MNGRATGLSRQAERQRTFRFGPRAGLPAAFRYTTCDTTSLALSSGGCSVEVVQKVLGPALTKVTLDTYGHTWPDAEDLTRRAIDAALGASISVEALARRSAQ